MNLYNASTYRHDHTTAKPRPCCLGSLRNLNLLHGHTSMSTVYKRMSTVVSAGMSTFISKLCITTGVSILRSIRKMGEITKLFLAVKGKDSLRTTIPMSIVKQWNLTSNDYLDWSWDISQNKMVVVVRKYESNTIAPDLQEGRENLSKEELDLEKQEAHGKKPH